MTCSSLEALGYTVIFPRPCIDEAVLSLVGERGSRMCETGGMHFLPSLHVCGMPIGELSDWIRRIHRNAHSGNKFLSALGTRLPRCGSRQELEALLAELGMLYGQEAEDRG